MAAAGSADPMGAPPDSPWGTRHCPDCRGPLDGGPVRYHCWSCARACYAADLDHEIRRTAVTPAAR
jgi:hypothetical protein